MFHCHCRYHFLWLLRVTVGLCGSQVFRCTLRLIVELIAQAGWEVEGHSWSRLASTAPSLSEGLSKWLPIVLARLDTSNAPVQQLALHMCSMDLPRQMLAELWDKDGLMSAPQKVLSRSRAVPGQVSTGEIPLSKSGCGPSRSDVQCHNLVWGHCA